MQNRFTPIDLFTLSHFSYAELFDGIEYVWEAIPRIGIYINSLFESGKIKGNYSQNVFIAEGAAIDQTARIEGPTIICKNARVGFHSYIRGNVIVGENAVVGSFVEVKNAVLMNTCKLAHFNYVSDSILGNEVRFGVGAVIANKRVDRKPITLKINEDKFETGLTKFGAVVGDDARIGANAVINPGTVLGRDVLVYPLESVFGVHENGEILK